MNVTVKPASNRILVEKIPEENPIYCKPEQKIIVVQTADSMPERPEDKVTDLWNILAVGSEIKDYKVGDIVAKHNFQTGTLVRHNSRYFLLLAESDIVCKFEVEGVVN